MPLDSEKRIAALAFAQAVVQEDDAHLGDPRHSLKHNLRRFDYVMARFGITAEGLGATAHGLRHEAMIEALEQLHAQTATDGRVAFEYDTCLYVSD